MDLFLCAEQNVLLVVMLQTKNRMKRLILIAFLFSAFSAFSQTGIIKGRVFDAKNNEPIPFANVVIQGTGTVVLSDIDGNYSIGNLKPDLYNIEVFIVGFKKKSVLEIQVFNNKPAVIDLALEEDVKTLEEVKITNSPFKKTDESPLSLRTIGVSEIERNPGGNRDISKVIQSLPGVASGVSFRNDIIIRGGAPNENRFYLDGIEVPNINHFATQGSSGGPVGMINVNFIREVDFYSGAFPAARGNTLSSVFEFRQKDPRTDRIGGNFTLGSSDFGLTLEGPISKKQSFMFSARRSYLQFLFKALQLPFLPTYNDFQLKYKIKVNDKNEINIIGLGAIDDFVLNKEANDTEEQRYILEIIPVSEQWNYTIGANWKNFRENGYSQLVVSRNMLSNTATKYNGNDESSDTNLLLKYNSREIENKLRFENNYIKDGFRFNYGAGYEFAKYTNSTYSKFSLPDGTTAIKDFSSALDFHKYGVFAQLSKKLFSERLSLSLGARLDGNSYSDDMSNPLKQVSPRFSASYSINELFSINFNTGRYFQLPAYTVLGFRNNNNELVNKSNNVTYIMSDHVVAGFEYNSRSNAKITIEGFYKIYKNYPFLLKDSISLANLGADFGVIGNEGVTSTSNGRSYGIEFLAQQKLFKGFYGIVAYTFVRSEFENRSGDLIPSAWDNQHIVALTGGKKFKRNWEIGVKWRFLGGPPYTPYDAETTALKNVWDINKQGVFDYTQLNSQRLNSVHQLDMRVDKKYFFKKWALNIYLDIQNAYGFKANLQPRIDVVRNADGTIATDPNDPTRYQTKEIPNTTGTVIPSIGIIIEL
jgi:hypothetical protein